MFVCKTFNGLTVAGPGACTIASAAKRWTHPSPGVLYFTFQRGKATCLCDALRAVVVSPQPAGLLTVSGAYLSTRVYWAHAVADLIANLPRRTLVMLYLTKLSVNPGLGRVHCNEPAQ